MLKDVVQRHSDALHCRSYDKQRYSYFAQHAEIEPASGHLILFKNQHLPCGGNVSRLQLVEIDPACDRFSILVTAIPVHCLGPIRIIARHLMP